MWPYWLIYVIPAWLSLKHPTQRLDNHDRTWGFLWTLCFIFLVLMIGYRYEVGGDWSAYNAHVFLRAGLKLNDLDLHNEPLFSFLAWLGAMWGGIYLFNLVSAAVFCYGLFRLCKHFSRPWLCLTLSIPYILIVVAMGYSRQAGALGAFMLSLLFLEQGNIKTYLFWVMIGATFHKSLVLMSILIIVNKKSFSLVNIVMITLIFFVFWMLIEEYILSYYNGYVINEYNSAGAFIRCSLNVLSATIYLLLRHRFNMFSLSAHRIYFTISILAWVCFIALFFSNISTAIDRMALYLTPLQFIILGNLPDVLGKNGKANRGWVLNMIVLYAIVEYVWLFKSYHSQYWLPYKLYLWEILW